MPSTAHPEPAPSVLRPANDRVEGAPLSWVLGVSLLYGGLLFVASHWPHEKLPWRELAVRYDKSIHVTLFALLAILVGWSIKAIGQSSRLRRITKYCGSPILLFGLLASYALFDEFSQQFTSRQFDWYDWAADLVGLGMGIVFVSFANQLRLYRGGTSKLHNG